MLDAHRSTLNCGIMRNDQTGAFPAGVLRGDEAFSPQHGTLRMLDTLSARFHPARSQ
jgi:hypothetical protein